MPSTAKTILGIVPGLQALAVVKANIPDDLGFGPEKKKKKKNGAKKMVKRATITLVGIGLMKPTAQMISAMP